MFHLDENFRQEIARRIEVIQTDEIDDPVHDALHAKHMWALMGAVALCVVIGFVIGA